MGEEAWNLVANEAISGFWVEVPHSTLTGIAVIEVMYEGVVGCRERVLSRKRSSPSVQHTEGKLERREATINVAIVLTSPAFLHRPNSGQMARGDLDMAMTCAA